MVNPHLRMANPDGYQNLWYFSLSGRLLVSNKKKII